MPLSGTTSPSIYKSLSLETAKNRNTKVLDSTKKTQAIQIVTNFIQYMKNKHI